MTTTLDVCTILGMDGYKSTTISMRKLYEPESSVHQFIYKVKMIKILAVNFIHQKSQCPNREFPLSILSGLFLKWKCQEF